MKTGRAQKVTVKANGGLSEDEVARMLKDAEANAEKDRKFREAQSAEANADYELKTSAKDPEQDWFKAAPQELKDQFNTAVKELTEARTKKDIEQMVEKTTALKNVRTAIGEAFTAASQPKPETPASGDAQPETAVKDPTPKPPAPPAPPAL